jgi:hypothetical protein
MGDAPVKSPHAHASLALAAGAVLTAIGAAAQTADSSDPIELFSKLMPVFSHPRCANCHGEARDDRRALLLHRVHWP